jgi:dipeptidyl aminopeptidase/acylaminoacyl peptidase
MRIVFMLVLLMAANTVSLSAQERVALHPDSGDPAEVELFISKPEGAGPWPVMLFVHGHQSAPRPGGRVFIQLDQRPALATVDEGRLETMRGRGYLAAAVSLPGYGGTTGPADFWGPRSQRAFRAALDHLLQVPGADPGKVAVYGVSGGAATASMEATTDPRIKALILVEGFYDVGEGYPTGQPSLDAYIEREAGVTPEAFAQRAALRYADKIQAATLILHRSDDVRGGMADQAQQLAEKLQANGKVVHLRVYENLPASGQLYEQKHHQIPISAQWEEIDPFLKHIIGK